MFWRFALLEFFAGRAGLGFELEVFNDVLWRLCDNVTDIVETFTACASCNLVEVAGGQNGGLVAAVLAELCKEHCADRNVHTHAERVRAANDFKQTLLCQLLAKDAVLGQEPCMVNADALL